jgi:hypothetical protein
MEHAVCLLVDGFGNAVKYTRQWDVLVIDLGPEKVFVKTREVFEGFEVYRLKDVPPAPTIRHIAHKLVD